MEKQSSNQKSNKSWGQKSPSRGAPSSVQRSPAPKIKTTLKDKRIKGGREKMTQATKAKVPAEVFLPDLSVKKARLIASMCWWWKHKSTKVIDPATGSAERMFFRPLDSLAVYHRRAKTNISRDIKWLCQHRYLIDYGLFDAGNGKKVKWYGLGGKTMLTLARWIRGDKTPLMLGGYKDNDNPMITQLQPNDNPMITQLQPNDNPMITKSIRPIDLRGLKDLKVLESEKQNQKSAPSSEESKYKSLKLDKTVKLDNVSYLTRQQAVDLLIDSWVLNYETKLQKSYLPPKSNWQVFGAKMMDDMGELTSDEAVTVINNYFASTDQWIIDNGYPYGYMANNLATLIDRPIAGRQNPKKEEVVKKNYESYAEYKARTGKGENSYYADLLRQKTKK